jgi:SAM-dependent methyltransferase
MDTTYWQNAADDETMQDEHLFIWQAMLETIDVDLAGSKVLDAGCNRGGFLRLLADRHDIAEGMGYDPADGAVDDAQRLTGQRPLRFAVARSVPAEWADFDVAFSHEVLYVLPDLEAHARAIHRSLRPGGVYYAVMGVHTRSPLMVEWHSTNAERLRLPPLYDVDNVIATFMRNGFDASISRLAIRFVPISDSEHHDEGGALDWLDYYSNKKVLFRFTRQMGSVSIDAR